MRCGGHRKQNRSSPPAPNTGGAREEQSPRLYNFLSIGGRGAFVFFLALTLTLLTLPTSVRADDTPPAFYLHDGDTVVFYGDSITEQQGYTRDIETFVLTRYPKWHIKFINSGWNGDRVTGGRGGPVDVRLKRDVLPYHPTVVTILLGMNDAAYTHFDEAAYATYTHGLTHIVDALQQSLPSARVTLLTPTFYDDQAPLARTRGLHTYNNVLRKYGAFVSALAAQRGLTVVDLNTPLREATITGRQHDPNFTLLADGIHPDEAGQLILAAAVLHAWHVPSEAAKVTVDPAAPVLTTLPLPWPLPASARPAFAVSSLPGRLYSSRLYSLPAQASGRAAGSYALFADGKLVGTLKTSDLAAGVDLTHLTLLPQNRQSALVLARVQERLDTWRYLWKGGPNAVARKGDTPTDTEIAALTALDGWLDTQRTSAQEAAQPQPAISLTLAPAPLKQQTLPLKLQTLSQIGNTPHDTTAFRTRRLWHYFGHTRRRAGRAQARWPGRAYRRL